MNSKLTKVLVALGLTIGLFGASYAALPVIPRGEEVYIRLNTFLANITNAATGSIMYTAGRDDWRPLAAPIVDNYSLFWDETTGIPFWGPTADTFTGTLLLASGGTGLTSYTQGDVPYYTSGTAFSKLAKSARPFTATRNTGASNAPAWGPVQCLIYSSLTESAAHTGATAAETTVMPATAEGTAATDIGTANMLAGATFEYRIWVDATGDVDGDETLTANVYFGAQLVGTTGAIPIDGVTDLVMTGTVDLEAAGAAIAGNYFCVNGSYPGVSTTTADLIAAFDTTGVQAFAVKLDYGGTTDAADTAKVQLAKLYICNFD